MLRAVLFDWGNTLVRFEWDDELFAAGHAAGLAALGRDDDPAELTRRLRDDVLPRLQPGDDYEAELRRLLDTDDVEAFVDAEHDAWAPAHALLDAAPALLDALRERGLKTALVGNAWPENGRVLRRDLDRFGLADKFDAIVFSSDVGVLKPDERIFRHALGALGVAPDEALFVGDRVDADIRGARAVGMKTVLAVWFRADDDALEGDADFVALNPPDVLNAVERLRA